jgi:phosphoglycerate dehydrogenase-like enzyme
MMKIVFTPTLSPAVASIAENLLPAGFDFEYLAPPSEAERRRSQLESADFLLGFFSGSRLPSSEYGALEGIKLLQLLSAGYDGMDLEKLRTMGIPLATNGGANAVAVAEHTILMMLAVYRQLVDLDRLVRAGGWKAAAMGEEVAHELAGKTVGIVGAGNIGRSVARRLQGWDVHLIYTDPFRLNLEEERSLQLEHVDLDVLLQRSDVVTLHAPADDTTRQLINDRTLGLMKRDAILINCARGELVDEAALHRALSEGQIAAAGLDTFASEPPEPDNPLLKLPNVVLTPHAAGPTWESWPKRFANGYANIERVARGEAPLWVVPELRELAVTR